MQAEIFQDQLGNFSSAYYLSSRYDVTTDNMDVFIEDISDILQENNVKIFSQYNEMNSQYHNTLHIYGNDKKIKESIENVANIEEREYTSLISGVTEVQYHDFSELDTSLIGYQPFLSYIGNENDIAKAYEEISEKYDLTYPQYWNSTEKDMIIIVWGMIIIIMIIINVIDVLSQKKEVTLRISFGENVTLITLKEILNNVISNVLLFFLAKKLLNYFVSGAYENKLVLMLYAIGILLSVVPYISYTFFDIKKAFANVVQSKTSIYVLYVLKFIVSATTIFTIATNFSSIHGNLMSSENLLSNYMDDNYFSIASTEYDLDEEKRFWETMYKKEYTTLNPVISINIFENKNDVIFVNNNAQNMLQGFEEYMDSSTTSADIIVFVPDDNNSDEYKNIANSQLDFCFDYSQPELEKLNIKYILYSGTEYFSYLDTSTVDGIQKTKNPIIIYQANTNTRINGGTLEIYKGGAILYNCTEAEIINLFSKYPDVSQQFEPIITNVYDQYIYTHNFFVKLVGFLSSLCAIVLLLDIFVIFTINRFEFKKNALKISLMKILGYSLSERHITLFRFIFVEKIIIFIFILSYSILSLQTNIIISILVYLVVSIIELLLFVINIIHTETTSVQKTLKGGCL